MQEAELFDNKYLEMIDGVLQVTDDAPIKVKTQFEEYLQGISQNEEIDISKLPVSFWHKDKETNRVWWKYEPNIVGIPIFSFDKQIEYNYYQDYPSKLTFEQKLIFDEENPSLKK